MSRENAQIVLKHLMENAAEHGATVLTISSSTDRNDIVITILDNGQGISEENRSRIFDAFFTTKREAGGTGMGLGIVQLMIHAHGGTIEALPSRQGALFEIILPAAG